MAPTTRTSPAARRRLRLPVLAAAGVLLLIAAACTRSPDEVETGVPGAVAPAAQAGATAPQNAAPQAGPGDFGTLKAICGPGTAKTATGRGVTATSINIGTLGDPGSSITPGLGQEFLDVADAFAAWCNKAGGINGRKIVVHKYDAKLLDVAARTLDACQSDFMLVGGGNALDAPGVQPRVSCGLGAIPAYGVSPQALNAPLQLKGTANRANRYPVYGYLAMARMFPDAMSGLGIGGSQVADIRPQGLRLQEALTQLGYKVKAYQELPAIVPNFRPFVEQLKTSGVQGYEPIGIQDLTPVVTAMNDVGLNLKFVLVENQLYDPKTIQGARSAKFPPTWLVLDRLPFEMADQSPVVKQAVDMVKTTVPKANLTYFTSLALNAWVLWAKSATACGDTLTVDCVLSKASSETSWNAGGLIQNVDLRPGHEEVSRCYLLMKVTADGFVYDKNATAPNQGFFNCSDKNVVTLANPFT